MTRLPVRQSWKDSILKLMKAGNHLQHAAMVSDVSGRILHQELKRDSTFKTQVEEIDGIER